MDSQGNIAMGYSASNGSNPAVFPSVRYTGRLAGDPPGVMTLGEGTLLPELAHKPAFFRWGDYTSLSVDPTDDHDLLACERMGSDHECQRAGSYASAASSSLRRSIR